MVDGTVRAVIYGGHRRPTQFGDTVLKGAMRVARDLAWEYSVQAEVERKLASLESEGGLPGQRNSDPVEQQEHRAPLQSCGRPVCRSMTRHSRPPAGTHGKHREELPVLNHAQA